MSEPLAVIEEDDTLECTIDNLMTRRESSVTLFKGVEWIFRLIPSPVAATNNDVKPLRHFSIEIGSNENLKSKTWFVDSDYSIDLFSSDDMTKDPIHKWSAGYTLKSADPTVRVIFFTKGTVVNERCDAKIELDGDDFDKVTHCRCQVTDIRLKGIPVRRLALTRLLSPRDAQSPHNRIIVVQKVKFYVQSQVLSMWSTYFDKLFHSEFYEKQREEIVLKDVHAADFEALLGFIYPQLETPKPKSDNVKSLLTLADRFDMPVITDSCRRFLHEDAGKTVNLFQLMQLAKEYSFADIQEVALSKLLVVPDLCEYIKDHSEDYDILDNLALRDVVYAFSQRSAEQSK